MISLILLFSDRTGNKEEVDPQAETGLFATCAIEAVVYSAFLPSYHKVLSLVPLAISISLVGRIGKLLEAKEAELERMKRVIRTARYNRRNQ